MEHSIEEIAALLHIHEKAHQNGGLSNIAAAALTRLRQINDKMPVQGLSKEEPPAEEPSGKEEPTKEEPTGEAIPTEEESDAA